MAADTVRIAGAKLNRKALYAAGAVGLGIVGYAWWTRKPEVPEEVVTEEELDTIGDERIPTTGVPYDPTIGGPSTGITTNAEWSQFATDRLQALGYDPIAVADALGLFLDRKPLSPAGANIARAAISQAGEPPQGRPWPVLTQAPTAAPPPAAAKPLAPASVRATGGRARLSASWSAVQGAEAYEARIIKGYPAGEGGAWRNVGLRTSSSWVQRVTRTTTYSVEVRAKNKAGTGPAKRSGPARVTP